MAYVEAHAGLRDHLKTKKVARLLGVPKVQVIGHMLCLWWWCQEYAQDGDLSGFDAGDIADAAEWKGEPQSFLDALLNCGAKGGAGFLRHDSDGALIVNDWYQYGGKLFVKREQSAARMRKMREQKGNKQDGYADVTRNDSVACASVTHIDKIREDKNIVVDKSTTAPDGAKPPKTPKPPTSEQSDMFGAICETCELDPKLNQGRVAKTAQSLLAAKYTPEQVRGFKDWWLADAWRAEHTPVPTVAKLTTHLQQYRNELTKPRVVPANGNGYNGNGRPTAPSKVERSLAAVEEVRQMLKQQQGV